VPRRFPRPVKAGLVLLVAGAVGLIALPADAATNGVVAVVQSNVVEYPALNGKTNNVVITRSGRTITVDDIVSLKAGAGCAAVSGDRTKVRCTTRANPAWIRVYLRDRNDSVVNKTDLPITADGGTGNDRITGGPRSDNLIGNDGADAIWGLGGNDELNGGYNDDALSGGDGDDYFRTDEGNDRHYGGNGDDSFSQHFRNGSDTDLISGGGGHDTVSYVSREKSITIDADGATGDDGEAGERDSIGADVEALQGGEGNDRLLGTPRQDFLSGGDGNDVLAGGGGNDVLRGEIGRDYLNGAAGDDILVGDMLPLNRPAADTLLGGPGRDVVDYTNVTKPLTIDLDGSPGDDGEAGERDTVGADVEIVYGGSGNDRITGNAAANKIDGSLGDDVLLGGGGDDELIGAEGRDTISGGAGDDTLEGVNGTADRLDGGANRTAAGDYCLIGGPDDIVAGCERIGP
jgi:Ca2+-binding RTX toxin-like protein